MATTATKEIGTSEEETYQIQKKETLEEESTIQAAEVKNVSATRGVDHDLTPRRTKEEEKDQNQKKNNVRINQFKEQR